MPYRKTEFTNDEIYHIVARRAGDKLLFTDNSDYYRGIFSIYEFNTTAPVEIWFRRRALLSKKRNFNRVDFNVGDPVSHTFTDKRDKLVEILSFSFMPNHIHLLLRQLKDGGISKFMNKLGAGYPAYFKKKHNLKEKGYFFQGRFASVHIKNDSQLIAAFVYIHTNPLALIEPRWKEGVVVDPQKAIRFLEDYRWSSYQDYLGQKNFPSLTERNFLLETLGGEAKIKELISDWIRHKKEIKGIDEIILE